jgi:hypothetical protein
MSVAHKVWNEMFMWVVYNGYYTEIVVSVQALFVSSGLYPLSIYHYICNLNIDAKNIAFKLALITCTGICDNLSEHR